MQEAHFVSKTSLVLRKSGKREIMRWSSELDHLCVAWHSSHLSPDYDSLLIEHELIYVCKLSYSRIPVKTTGHFGRHLELVWHEWRIDDAYFSFS